MTSRPAGKTGGISAVARHRITRLTIAFGIGLAFTLYVFERAGHPESAAQRAREETMVLAARDILAGYIPHDGPLEIVDPLAPRRAIGKVYVYPSGPGFEVSGYYRRDDTGRWHPFLMQLAADATLVQLAVGDGDEALARRAAVDPKFRAGDR